MLFQNTTSYTGYLRRVTAAFMILLFAFAITPKKIVHDLIADHKDGGSMSFANDHTDHIQAASFNCHCDNLVVESPFVTGGIVIKTQPPLPAQRIYKDSVVELHPPHHLSSSLRGPPSLS